jgi:tRNA(His) 5'-end guanylyltransferase
MEQSKDTLGDRLKAQEQAEAGRKADSTLPLMCRLDGKAFHTFTRGLMRPYDTRLSDLMCDTTRFLVEKTNARLGYTQSDEITLCWWNDANSVESEYLYDGKFQKLTSVLASMAGGFFNAMLPAAIPEKSYGRTGAIQAFDARVWNVPDLRDVYLNFLWRQDDAIKNSISMAAQAKFSHKTLHGVGSEQKKSMLRDVDAPWEDEPQFFKMGTFFQRIVREVTLTPEMLEKIPKEHWPTGPVKRTFVEPLDVGYLKNSPDFVYYMFGEVTTKV